MASCSVVRIGPTTSPDCSVIRSAVLRHFRSAADADDAGDGPPGPANDDGGDELVVSNRYFDARVRLVDLESPPVAGEAAEDGVVLVFDSTAAGFDGLPSHHDAALLLNSGDLLRLCVSCSRGPSPLSDGTERSEAEYSRRVLWCLDRGYEYVEADVTEEGLRRGHDERDREGFARVVEAVGGCMWTSRVMRRRGAGSKPPAGGVQGEKVDAGQSSGAAKTSEDRGQSQQGPSDGPPSNDDADREDRAVSHLMREVEGDDDPATSPAPSPAAPPEEVAMHKLEQTLAEARAIRDASRNDTMSDEERRRRAGDAAMRLVGLLGEMGLGDDSDDDDSDE